jgi:hypothetical protein
MLKGQLVNNDNLHRIAISNLEDQEKSLVRWWCDHYRQPPKPLDDYTVEELYIERLEHYYSKKPERIKEFLDREAKEWDGGFDDETEKEIARFSKGKTVDLTKYQKDSSDLSDEAAQRIIDNLGMHLPGSKVTTAQPSYDDNDDFDDEFE